MKCEVCRKLQAAVPLPDPEVGRIVVKLTKYEQFVRINWEQVISSSESIDMSVFHYNDDASTAFAGSAQAVGPT